MLLLLLKTTHYAGEFREGNFIASKFIENCNLRNLTSASPAAEEISALKITRELYDGHKGLKLISQYLKNLKLSPP